MEEQLQVSNSPDLLNEFLGQNGEEQEKPSIINDEPNKSSESIKPEIDNSLDFINELPEGFENDEEKEVKEKEETTEVKSQGEYSFKALAGYLSEEGIIDFEDSEGLEDNPELLIESVKGTIAKEIQAYKNSIPDKAKQILEYLEQGGSIDSYLSKVQNSFDVTALDLTNERDQEVVVRENLKLQGYDSSEVDETIQDYKDSLILDKQAKIADKQVKKYNAEKEEAVLASQEQEQAQRAEQYKTYVSNINTTIDTADSIAGLHVDTKDKLSFKQYLLGRDKEGYTAYERELAEDPVKTQLELAYLKFKKYDFTKASKQGETAATKRIKDIFKRSETNNTTGKSVEEVSGGGEFDAFRGFQPRRR